VLEESILPLLLRRGGKRPNFLRREKAIRDVNQYLPRPEILDIHPQSATSGHPPRHPTVRVRNIERQLSPPPLRIDNLRAHIGVRGKNPRLGMEGRVARQSRPRQGPRNQITPPIPWEIKPRFLLLLRGIDQFPIGGMQALLGYLIVKS